jgi:gas vesicle protein
MFGILAGMCAGMLLAPKAGEEIREQLRTRALEAKVKTRAKLDEQREAGRDRLLTTLEKSKGLADKAADRVKDAADSAADRTKETADRASARTANAGSRQ